ncbi:hypothetical protein C8J56DRAFT_235612 [Mycena floridula]|nr:hypothetical protein C8J56DRAFT_235612 [Mycena floridula]
MFSFNPFLVVRFIFLSLVVYLTLLVLAFAAWNVHSNLTYGGVVVPATGVILFNSCATLLLVPLSTVELLYPQYKSGNVRFESLWTAIVSLFQLGASIGLTSHNQLAVCRANNTDWRICASTSLLIPTIWLSTFTVLTYFIVLFGVTMAHQPTIPDVWSKTVYTVGWFTAGSDSSSPKALISKPMVKPGFENDSWTLYLNNIQSSGVTGKHSIEDVEKAPWATAIRRGVDQPFAQRDADNSSQSSLASKQTSPLPHLPVSAQVQGSPAGSRFIERFRESRTVSRSQIPFVSYVADDNQPIPLPQLSEWLKADALRS